jgi:hypothetical protein
LDNEPVLTSFEESKIFSLMKKITLLLSIACATSLVILSSCKDDDKSKTELLTEKSWVLSKAEVEVSGASIDVTDDYIDDCQGDNTITFTKAGVYTEVVGTDDCNGDESDETGTWEFKNGETTLSIDVDGDVQDLEIATLNGSTLKVNFGKISYDTNGDGTDDAEVSIFYSLSHK